MGCQLSVPPLLAWAQDWQDSGRSSPSLSARLPLGAEKSLYFGGDCSGSLEMENLEPKDASRKALEMPGVCALCWALEYLDVNPMPEWGERRHAEGGPADPVGGY